MTRRVSGLVRHCYRPCSSLNIAAKYSAEKPSSATFEFSLEAPQLFGQFRRQVGCLDKGDQQLFRPERPQGAVLAMPCHQRDEVPFVEGQARRLQVSRQLREKLLPAPGLGKLALMFSDLRDPRMNRADQGDALTLRQLLARPRQRPFQDCTAVLPSLSEILGNTDMRRTVTHVTCIAIPIASEPQAGRVAAIAYESPLGCRPPAKPPCHSAIARAPVPRQSRTRRS
jgi:hypothetical protein